MKQMMAALLLGVFLLSGCALGPLANHETARSVGNSKHELIVGAGQSGWVGKWNYGLTEDLDLGIHYESLSLGVRAKYSFLNSNNGWSIAGALGTGTNIGGSHTYGDFMVSHMSGTWEPYATFRYVSVKTDPVEFKDTDTGELHFTIDTPNFNYGHYFLGTRIWFTPKFLLSLEFSKPVSLNDDFRIDSETLFSGALGYRF